MTTQAPLEATLDLNFARDWARELYAVQGRPSIDSVMFFRLQLNMFFAGIRSARKLIETARLNLHHRWNLGYARDDPPADHSSLIRIRRRLGVDVFARFFENQEVVYRADAATGSACPVKTTCTMSDHGRIVHRSFFAHYVEMEGGYHTTD